MDQNTWKIYYTTSWSFNKIIRIIVETYVELSIQARNQKFLKTEEVSWNKVTSINIFSTTHEREAPHGQISEIFTTRYF